MWRSYFKCINAFTVDFAARRTRRWSNGGAKLEYKPCCNIRGTTATTNPNYTKANSHKLGKKDCNWWNTNTKHFAIGATTSMPNVMFS